MDFIRQSLVIAGKDLTLEMRSRDRVLSMVIFSVLVAVVFSFSLDPAVSKRAIAGAMIWVTILYAGMLGLGRSFALEQEQDALVGVLLTPIDRGAVYFGKFVANLALLLTAVFIIFLIYGLFFSLLSTIGSLGGLVLITVLACVGFMALGTLFSAVSMHTSLGNTLLPIVLIPLLIPVVIFGTDATQRLLLNRPLAEVTGQVRMLIAFDLIFVIVCTMIFSSVVEE